MSYLEQLQEQKKRSKTQVSIAAFGILLFLALILTLPNYLSRNQQELRGRAQDNSASQSGAIPQGMIAEWKLDEGGGTIAADSSGNGNTGTLLNGPVWVSGKLGSAVSFDGIDDTISVPTNNGSLNNISSLTLSLWMYPKSLASDFSVLIKKKVGASRFRLAVDNTSRLIFSAGYTSSQGSWTTLKGLTLNTWHHLAVVYPFGDTSSNPTIYIDGASSDITKTVTPLGAPIADDNVLNIGSNNSGTNVFNGLIDEMRIYNRLLSSSEVVSLYQEGGSSPSKKPNIVVIETDDQDDTGSMAVMTQVNNLLAKQGVTFKNSFAENPICCPSRATFLTGQVSHNNTVVANNDRPDGGYKRLAPTANNTLPVWLKQAGYQTAFMGKYVNGYPAGLPSTAIAPGWDTWFELVNPYLYYNYTLNENGTLHTYGSSASDYQTDVLAKKATDYISSRTSSAQPFFLWLTPVAPHWGEPGAGGVEPEPAPRHKGLFSNVPLPQPLSFNEADISDKPSFIRPAASLDVATLGFVVETFHKRREALLAVDEMVGNIVDTLTRTGQLDNTLIIYTSDNGFFQGEHRFAAGKALLYEESIRVPLVVRGPGIGRGLTRTELVNNADIVATIVDAAKATPGRVLDGRSLTPLLKNTPTSWRSAMLFEGQDYVPIAGAVAGGYGAYAAIRTNQFIYAEHALYTGSLEKEFYDLSVDPYELESRPNNPNYSSVIAKLADKLHILKTCQGATCWITDATPTSPGIPVTAPSISPLSIHNQTPLDMSVLKILGHIDSQDEVSAATP